MKTKNKLCYNCKKMFTGTGYYNYIKTKNKSKKTGVKLKSEICKILHAGKE